jgi:hypothetical protein
MAQFSQVHYYEHLLAQIAHFKTSRNNVPPSSHGGIWAYLQVSEQHLIQLMQGQDPPDNEPGNIELGPVLYLANNDAPHWITDFLRWAGMPPSKITPAEWASWQGILENGPGVVSSDGTLISTVPYAQLDLNWVVVAFTSFIIHLDWRAPFATTPATIAVPAQNTLSVALFGDWGTGNWQDGAYDAPAVLVGQAIQNMNPRPDISIHLGDVYYAGLEFEETDYLLQNFPAGSMHNFTLNSNHEMYDGAFGYFQTALASQLFSAQQKTSYFALTFEDWILIGLDTAYYDSESTMYMEGALKDANQLTFIKNLGITAEQKIIVCTHHNGIVYDGTAINDPLFSQLYDALGSRYPDYWYYGHIHNGIVYNDQNAITRNYTTQFGKHPQLRCTGHASIPFGNGYGLQRNEQNTLYYAKTPMPKPDDRQTNRVLNGFTVLTLSAGAIQEDFYEVSIDGVTKVWSGGQQFT